MWLDCSYAVFLLVQLMNCVSRLSIFINLRSGVVSACPGEADQTEPCNNQDCKGKPYSIPTLADENSHDPWSLIMNILLGQYKYFFKQSTFIYPNLAFRNGSGEMVLSDSSLNHTASY